MKHAHSLPRTLMCLELIQLHICNGAFVVHYYKHIVRSHILHISLSWFIQQLTLSDFKEGDKHITSQIIIEYDYDSDKTLRDSAWRCKLEYRVLTSPTYMVNGEKIEFNIEAGKSIYVSFSIQKGLFLSHGLPSHNMNVIMELEYSSHPFWFCTEWEWKWNIASSANTQ